MAQVIHASAEEDRGVQDKIDHYLDYELQAWESVPELAARWAAMDALDKEAFHLHWKGVTEGYLREIDRLSSARQLSVPQLVRHKQLQALVTRYRPVIERLLAE